MKKEAEENGWNVIEIRQESNVAYFSKFDNPLVPRELKKMKQCDIHILNPDVDLEEYHTVDKDIKNNLAKFLNLTCLMFELVPLFSFICEDPMLNTFPEGEQFLKDYKSLSGTLK